MAGFVFFMGGCVVIVDAFFSFGLILK